MQDIVTASNISNRTWFIVYLPYQLRMSDWVWHDSRTLQLDPERWTDVPLEFVTSGSAFGALWHLGIRRLRGKQWYFRWRTQGMNLARQFCHCLFKFVSLFLHVHWALPQTLKPPKLLDGIPRKSRKRLSHVPKWAQETQCDINQKHQNHHPQILPEVYFSAFNQFQPQKLEDWIPSSRGSGVPLEQTRSWRFRPEMGHSPSETLVSLLMQRQGAQRGWDWGREGWHPGLTMVKPVAMWQ